MRYFVRALFLAAALLLIFPFVAASLLLDERGIPISGHIYSKSEYITVGYSTWTRHLEAQIRYDAPDDASLAFTGAQLEPDLFDSLKKGDAIQLRYLPVRDSPSWPGFRTMRQMRVLPFVRLASEDTWTGPASIVRENHTVLAAVLMVGFALVVWRALRLPFFLWVVAACCLITVVVTTVKAFPEPTRAPRRNLRTASGTIKNLETWRFLFRSNQDRNAIRWVADQPITVAGVEFVPEGRTEPVVAVDLIDSGSIPGLAEHSTVNVEYESASPRVAYIRGATRRFAGRNLRGLALQVFYLSIVTAVLLSLGKGISLLYHRLAR